MSQDRERQELIVQIAERHAFRHHAAINLRGHGMQFLEEVGDLRRYAEEIQFHVGLLEEVEKIHAEAGAEGLAEAVMPRMERVPYPESRLELACCMAVTGRGERAAAKAYVESSHPGLAAVSAKVLNAERPPLEEDVLVEFCRREDQREQAQVFWSRWIQLSLGSVGRIGNAADRLTAELGLRPTPASEVVRVFLDDLEPLREACSLSLPSLGGLGVELPEELRGRFPSA